MQEIHHPIGGRGITQKRRLAQRRDHGPLLVAVLHGPLAHLGEQPAKIDAAPPLKCHRHGLPRPPPRVRGERPKVRDEVDPPIGNEAAEADHAADGEELLRRVRRRAIRTPCGE
jgi:hypothetical protein